jgi:hypothetical protein
MTAVIEMRALNLPSRPVNNVMTGSGEEGQQENDQPRSPGNLKSRT